MHHFVTRFWHGAAVAALVAIPIAGGCAEQNSAAKDAPDIASSGRASAAASPAPLKPGEAADWPNFRGPRHDLISAETGWADTWPADGPQQLWKVKVGTGFSSVSVVGNRLYTMGHDGRKEGGDDTVYCLDATSGAVIWKQSYPCALVDNLHEGGPAATPTVHAGRVYTVSKEGLLHCFAADSGNVLWKQPLQKLLGVPMPEWGFSCSPRVVGDLLIVEAGRTCALNPESGQLIWQSAAYRPGYGSISVVDHEKVRLIAVLNNDCLLLVSIQDGKEVAQQKWEAQFATSAITPLVDGDTIFISAGYNAGGMLTKLADDKLQRVWQNKNMSNHMANCVLWEGHLYGFDGNTHNRRNAELRCVDKATGELKWQERGLGVGSLMLADGKLIALSDEGELVIAKATAEGFQPISRANVLSGKCWTVPVLCGGRLYCRNAAGDLVCLDLRKPT